MTSALAPAPVPEPLPLPAVDGACRTAAAALGAAAGTAPPAVVPLGAHDTLRAGRDPYAAHRPGARVHLARDAVLIGPWGADAGPERACGQCLAMRWQRLRTRSEREALETGGEQGAGGDWPVLPAFVLESAAALLAAAADGTAADGLPRVTRLDLATLQVATHPLLREPLCRACGAQGLDRWLAPGAPEPDARRKPDPDTCRLVRPADYALPHAALANPVCGVLGAATWTDITSPTTAPVAGSVFMRGYAGLTDVTWSGQANSFTASRDLAFLEGLERYAGTHRRDREPLLVAAYEDLGDAALDPRTTGTYPAATYRDDPMVAPFDPARPIPWIPGHSLRDGRTVLVPARLVHYSAGVAADNFVFECSNGCAIGSCTQEAVLFGLLELIERDAFLLGWYGRLPQREIDLASCGGRRVRAMADRAALCGYDVRAFDGRVDLSVPVVTALAVRRDGGPGTLAFAAGAAFDPEAAVESALSEILTYIPHLPGQVAERPAELAAMAADYGLVKRLPDHAALFGLPEMAAHCAEYLEPGPARPLGELYADWHGRRPRTLDLGDDLAVLREDLVAAGFDVLVVDQTTPEQRRAGLSTVSAIVPGLLPIDFGWSRQRALTMPRLRTAPRRAGLRPADLAEGELRLVPHPFP